MMGLIKKIFGIDEDNSSAIAWACALHVLHAFLYGAFGGIKNHVDITSTNWNLVLFLTIWQYIGIIVEYYIAFRYIQLIVNAVAQDIRSTEDMPGKNLFTALVFMAAAFAGIRFMEYFGSVFWKLIIVAVILLIFFSGAFLTASGTFGGFVQGSIFIITAGPIYFMSAVAAFFSWFAPFLLGLAALGIIIDSIRFFLS